MKKQSKFRVKIQLALLLVIAAAAPCLYAQCVVQTKCYFGNNEQSCEGSGQAVGDGEGGIYLGNGGACGEMQINGDDTGEPCGATISGLCA